VGRNVGKTSLTVVVSHVGDWGGSRSNRVEFRGYEGWGGAAGGNGTPSGTAGGGGERERTACPEGSVGIRGGHLVVCEQGTR